MKILLVDDSSFKRKALGYVIGRQGHEVIEAIDGEEGLEKARSYRPDLIVSDLLMPKMDGFNFLRNIKKDEQLRDIPFVVYSVTYKEEKVRELVASLGAAGFLEDLDKPEEFWQQLQEIIESDRCKEGQICKPIMKEDEEFLKSYAHIVTAKLEDKVRELEEEINKRKQSEEALREGKEKFLSIFTEARDGIVLVCAKTGFIIDGNPEFERQTGRRLEELKRMKIWEIRPPEKFEAAREKHHEIAVAGVGGSSELEFQQPGGRVVPVEFLAKKVVIGGKEYIQSFSRDITERKKMEDDLRYERDIAQTYLDIAGTFFVVIDSNEKVTLINKKGAEILGSPEGEITGKNWFDNFLPEKSRDEVRGVFRKVISGGMSNGGYYENPIITSRGAARLIAWHNTVLKDNAGNITGTLSSGEDITERKRLEDELRLLYTLIREISLSKDSRSAIEVTLRHICEATGWVMGEAWVPSADKSHLECSPVWYGKSGFDSLEKFRKVSERFSFQPGIGFPGRTWSSKRPVWDTDVTLDANFLRGPYAKEAGLKGAMAIPILSGGEVVAVMDFFVIEPKEEDSRLIGLVSTVASYMGTFFQRKQAEEELRKLSHAVEQSPVSVFITNAEGDIEYVNPKFTETTGYSRKDVIGKKPDILASGAAALSDTGWKGEFLAGKKSGEMFWEYSAISPIVNNKGDITNFVGISEDITERRKLEEQLRHSQKLEATGQLVGGIAHDFNNILTAVIGFGKIMQMKLSKEDPLTEYLEQIIEAAERGAILTRSLLIFGRKQAIFPRPVNLNEIVKHMKKLLSRLIGEGIELRTVTMDSELTVMADSLQIEQVLMNLATNARDAMQGKGTLLIETRREKIDKMFIKSHGYGERGEYALISVSDSGVGMDEETREKVFEPFFTTKEVGKGTGLGLSIVYGILKQHNGYITVYSEVGKGTTFKIYLPMARPVAVEAAPVETMEPPASAMGTETVLVAEDDAKVRKLAKTLLETFGYTVIEAENGEEAVQKYLENKDAIKLLILDAIMPRKNGREAYEEIKKIAPEVRVIFMSGYTANVMQAKESIENGLDFISKPILPTEFIKKVREALDR